MSAARFSLNFPALALLAFVMATSFHWTFCHSAEAARIHVRGSARLSAHVARVQGDVVVEAKLTDDAGEPIGRAAVDLGLSLAADDDAHPAGDFSDATRIFRPCRGGGGSDGTRGPLDLRTDSAGEICLRATLPMARYVVHLGWGGSALVDGAKLDVPVDMERAPLALRFDPEPRVVHLDGPVFLEMRAHLATDMAAPATGLELVVTDERGHELGHTRSDSFGRAELEIDPHAFAPPGKGSLTLGCRGEECPEGAQTTLDVERHAAVQLSAHDEPLRTKMQSPEEGLPLDVDVKTALGPVTSGTLEARVGDIVVGAAPVQDGTAHLTLTFAADQAGEVGILLRYLPSTPWFETGRGAIAHAQVKPRSRWRDSPFVAIGVVVLAWLVLGRTRVQRPRIPPPPPEAKERTVEPSLEIVATSESIGGWKGVVRSAYDGEPLAGVAIGIERGGFARTTRVADTVSDGDGRFELPAIARTPGDALVAESRLYSDFRQPLPPSVVGGEIVVRLTSRRHALVARLVAWSRARVRGDARLDPTPAQVRRSSGTPEAQRWADATERAAFGPDDVDARVEASVDALAPAAPPPQPAAVAAPPAPGPPKDAP